MLGRNINSFWFKEGMKIVGAGMGIMVGSTVGAGLGMVVESAISGYNLESQLERALKMDEAGDKIKAQQLLVHLVRNNPSCKACRGHMGRVTKEINDQLNAAASYNFKR